MVEERNGSPSPPLRWVPEFLELGRRRFRAQGRVLGAAVLVGIIAGLGAVLFSVACQAVVRFTLDAVAGYRAGAPAHEARASWDWLAETEQPLRPWLLLVIAPLGGLASGFLVFRFAPEAEGHGTDAAIAAYHHQGSIRPQVPLIKLLASALTIGTGGSGGREGPIAQIGAGFGSFLANLLGFRPAERRILLAAGMGAGIAAIFRAPLAGALFAAEVLYWSPEFEPEVIIPAGIASVISYTTFGAFFGWTPLFYTPELHFTNPWQLGPYLLLALFMALLAMIYTRTFHAFTRMFHRLNISRYFKPAVGAFLTAVVGVGLYYVFHLFGHERAEHWVLSVLSFGYGILQEGLTADAGLGAAGLAQAGLTAGVLLAVAVGKILTTSLTIGSGGSGGVFGPSMVIGGCGGAALGVLLHGLWPGLVPHPASFLIVGMAGFFAAAAKTPFSTLIIVCEMTGSYELLVPALWVCAVSFLLSDEQSLYENQVESRAQSPAHQGSFAREVLAGLRVSQFLKPDLLSPVLHPDDPLPVVLERLSGQHTVLPEPSSISRESYREVSVRFHDLPHTDRDAIVLPETILQVIERNVLGLLRHGEALRRSGRSTRHGLLFHGPPGTGKTLTARYLARTCTEHTVILLTGRQLGLIRESCQMARLLAPSIVILEDIDLVAEERSQNKCPTVLHELLDEMDGLGTKTDCIFLLTTNRPEILEPALAARPGRIDQAVEFPLPDAACRGRLFALYGKGLDLTGVDQERWVRQTDGVSPAFIEELLRKAALLAAERGETSEPLRLTDADIDQAVKELVFFGGNLTQRLLGYRSQRLGYRAEDKATSG
jgi:CIC family chloride channel protein